MWTEVLAAGLYLSSQTTVKSRGLCWSASDRGSGLQQVLWPGGSDLDSSLPGSQRPRMGRGAAASASLSPLQGTAPSPQRRGFPATPPPDGPQNTGISVNARQQQGSSGTTTPAQAHLTTPMCFSYMLWTEKQNRPFPSPAPSTTGPPLTHTCHTHADTLSVHCENKPQGPGDGWTTKP